MACTVALCQCQFFNQGFANKYHSRHTAQTQTQTQTRLKKLRLTILGFWISDPSSLLLCVKKNTYNPLSLPLYI